MGVTMPSAALLRRGAMLQEMLASANSRQLAAAAFATGLSTQRLRRYAQGASWLDAAEIQRVAEFLLRGRYFVKSMPAAA
jgi:hypothetical protein